MPVSAGTRLGPYEIVAPLGAGGMGEVWKARDTRLDRSVAIKVLPAGLTNDAHFRSRFEREAKAISQLNHPHICTLHDIGDDNGTSYLVMELVEGESLADRLERGPLPMSDVLVFGAQMADALDRAHRAGIVHRDLKPGNVMITKGGVKLLDFGLAKAAMKPSSTPHETTIVHQKPLTAEGTVVGTIQYMAPEQIAGDAVDGRSDIFALGAVLYEMATGKRAFLGSNRTSLIAAIVSSDPRPMTELQPLTPPAFEHIVAKCLAKDPERRWQSAHDVAEQLRWIAQRGSAAGSAAAPGKTPMRFRSAVPWLIAAAAVAVTLFPSWRIRPIPTGRVTKTIISTDIGGSWNMAPAISPDGRHIAYPTEEALWIRSLAELEPHKVPITGVQQPVLFWSPDSRWIAFISDYKLWKIAVDGSLPVLIAPLSQIARHFHSGAWGADDRIVLAALFGGLYEVSARGGLPVEALAADPGLVDFHNLSFLPDGRTLLAVPHKLDNMAGVEVIRGKKRQTIATFDAQVRDVVYSRTGHLLVSRRGINAGLWAMPFSTETMAQTGKEFLVAAGAGACTASSDGSLSYVVNIDYAPKQIVHLDGKAKIIAKIGGTIDTADHPILSPDEKTLAISAREEDNSSSVELVDSVTGTRRRMTHGFVSENPASWSHDGRQLVVQRQPTFNWSDPRFGVWLVPVDNTGEPRKLASGWGGRFTPDDSNVVFLILGLRKTSSMAAVPVRGGAPVVIMKSPFQRETFALSPDGHFVAYRAETESESPEIYVTRYPSGEGKWQVSPGEAALPTWSRDGRTIYFASGNRLMSASFGQSPDVVVGPPVMLFDATPLSVRLDHGFQVLRDGSLIAIQDLPPDKRQVVLAQNWLAEFSEDERH